MGNKVSREKNRIGTQAVDVADGIAEKVRLGKSIEMNIAQLNDVIAVKSRGQFGQLNG